MTDTKISNTEKRETWDLAAAYLESDLDSADELVDANEPYEKGERMREYMRTVIVTHLRKRGNG